jgi:hypothetical protein
MRTPAGPATDRGRQGRPGGPARSGGPGGWPGRALHRLLRRPQLRRRRARLQGAEVHPRRGRRGHRRQRADLCHQQPPPPAARVHEGQPPTPTPTMARCIPARWWRRRSRCPSASGCGSASTRSARRVPGRSWRSGCATSASARRSSSARQEALVWALERGSRSGRVAYQFARDWAGRGDAVAGAVGGPATEQAGADVGGAPPEGLDSV